MKKYKIWIAEIIGVIALVAIDQWTKSLAVLHIQGKGIVGFIPNILQFHYIENTGGAFSFFENNVQLFAIFTGIFLFIGTGIYIWYFNKHKDMKWWYHVLFVLVLAGGLGNLIDRIQLGYVVDFLEFAFFSFPIFNVADIYVTLVMALLLIGLVRDEVKKV